MCPRPVGILCPRTDRFMYLRNLHSSVMQYFEKKHYVKDTGVDMILEQNLNGNLRFRPWKGWNKTFGGARRAGKARI